MKNAHLRFGKLKFIKQATNSTTHIKLHMDRFIGESKGQEQLLHQRT